MAIVYGEGLNDLGFEDWLIPRVGYTSGGWGRGNWYISRAIGYEGDGDLKVEYLHKDLTWHCFCGAENFWDDEEGAQEALDSLDSLQFIKEEEMMIC